MELIRKASKFDPKDFISIMPDNVVTNILDRLPLQDAVRTGILSRNWRSKWTMLSQLVFDVKFFQYLLKTKGENNYGKIISSLVLHLEGAITKFTLYIDERSNLDDEDINNWILFLSGKGIKDLTIWNRRKLLCSPIKLSTHLFSCLELKHLKLKYCCLYPPASFHGFPNLLTLELTLVQLKSSELGKFVTRCPLLESLNLACVFLSRKIKLIEIAKLANLKILSFVLSSIDEMVIKSSSSIFELVSFLPKLQELNLDFGSFKFTQGAANKESSTSFPCLKALKLRGIDLGDGIMLSCAFELIRCSPNLQTLDITADECDAGPPPAIPRVDYNTMGPLQLRRVVFRDLKGLENEVCLIKYLLACSPFLKKMEIHPHSSLVLGEILFAEKLSKLSPASSIAVIDLH